MSFLVLDSEQNAAARLSQQLKNLGFNSVTTHDFRVAHDLCNKGGVEVLVCFTFQEMDALADIRDDIYRVLATTEALDTNQILTSMRAGCRDCWHLPIDDTSLAERVETLLTSRRNLVVSLNNELSNARNELERDQRAGQHIQMGMLPPNPMVIGHYKLQHRVIPSLILSGDFVDYFQITDRHFACYVADVAGHGASSAFVTVSLKNFSRRLRREYRSSMLRNPGEVLAWFSNELLEQQIDKHVALFFAIVDLETNRLYFSNAAHFPPALVVQGGRTIRLEQPGKPVGLFPDVEFASQHIDLEEGARLVVFTDGVLELMQEESLEAKEDRIADVATRVGTIDELWNELELASLGPDDVSCLVVSHEQM
jgi:sigma-B regulation protein RsbU (phosphoserine phosphatase)